MPSMPRIPERRAAQVFFWGGPKSWGYPKMEGLQWKIHENPLKMKDVAGYPHVSKPPRLWFQHGFSRNTHERSEKMLNLT